MSRSRAFPIVVVVPHGHKSMELGRVDVYLSGLCRGQLFWDDDREMALRFSSAEAASEICARLNGAKIRVAFA